MQKSCVRAENSRVAVDLEILTEVCFLPPGGWALNRKELKLLQTIGKGEFGGEETDFTTI